MAARILFGPWQTSGGHIDFNTVRTKLHWQRNVNRSSGDVILGTKNYYSSCKSVLGRNRLIEALELERETLQIRRNTRDPEAVRNMQNIVAIYKQQGKL